MVKPIVKDILFLGQKSVPATQLDMNVVNDLRDTLAANRERCVGMAANMIGYKKNMIIVSAGPVDMIMINPVICSKQEYQKNKH
jgi:peptide deformylase